LWIAGDREGQPALLAVDARALLPADHRVWDFLAMVDELDLSAFEAAYRGDGVGRPPYWTLRSNSSSAAGRTTGEATAGPASGCPIVPAVVSRVAMRAIWRRAVE
jgi:hypothetical protein